MTKKNVTLSISADLHHQIKMRNFNFSEETEELWRQKLAFEDSNPEKLDYELLTKELDKETKIHQESGLKINNLQSQLNQIKEKQEKLEIERLEKEKVEITKIKQCGSCGRQIHSPTPRKGVMYRVCIDCLSNLYHSPKLEDFRIE